MLAAFVNIFSVGTLRTKFLHAAKFDFYFITAFDPTPTFAGAIGFYLSVY